MINIVTDDNHYSCIHGDIVALLENARRATARSINALMTASYWEIGRRIVVFEQGGQERATYGETLVERLAFDLASGLAGGSAARTCGRCARSTWPGLPTTFSRHCLENRHLGIPSIWLITSSHG